MTAPTVYAVPLGHAVTNVHLPRLPNFFDAVLPEGCAKFMICRMILGVIFLFLAFAQSAAAELSAYRIGVLLPGGPLYETVDGLRQGLRELGLKEGNQFSLIIKDVQGDAAVADEAARTLEKTKVNLIYALTTPVITKAKAATSRTPMVFTIGSDPVDAGLVESFAEPGGRLTGVHYLVRDLTAKRLEVLREILPKISSVLTYYNPTNRVAAEGATLARDEAKRIGVKLIERHVRSVDELKSELHKLKTGEAEAFFYIPDPMVASQARLIIDTTKAKKFPAMFQDQTLVIQGALASYGQNYREIGRLSAKYVQQILHGARPKDLKIETVDSVELAINLQTAKQLGIAIPPQVLARAQKVIR